jgi:hypothetical protein
MGLEFGNLFEFDFTFQVNLGYQPSGNLACPYCDNKKPEVLNLIQF